MKKLIMTLIVVLACGVSFAEPPKLATSWCDLKESLAEAKGVYICRIVSHGKQHAGSMGMLYYDGIDLEVLEVIAGRAVNRLIGDMSIESIPNHVEALPEIGKKYIVIGYPSLWRGAERDPGVGFSIRKVLLLTPENLRIIKELLDEKKRNEPK